MTIPGAPSPEDVCEQCAGSGWVRVAEEPGAAVRRCSCHLRRDTERRLELARIPARYADVDLENFSVYPGIDPSLDAAKLIVEKFVAAYPGVESGLLFEGRAGVGKTHLAVAVLRRLIEDHGVTGRFVDYRDLLGSIQDSYNPVSETSELEILRPVLSADVLLLDELGTRRPTAWVRDTVTQLLNDRYKRRKLTLITTNYRDEPDDPADMTLEDRIGPYARSRLFEMCRNVPMRGKDFRELTGSGTVQGRTHVPPQTAARAKT